MSQSEPTSPPNGASLVLTICASKKDALGEAEFHDYLTHSHAPLVKQVLARHGITRYTMTHNTTATKSELAKVMDAQFSQQLQYDVITQIRFPSMQSFVNFRNDSFYKEMVMPDHDVFTDADKTFITVGWVEDHIVDGRAA
ncbi:dimeric alpha-beta barrel [Cladorrhinum samala]|uniref:Dimeric alpha-beta barrel n=1 Tax=Cladorrhinum samala TaxID=585594 RepID=A0AAV9HH60_9PEZI|nr:dimeric alpha-beta barrel [Cladorrhinum samala]